jgi:YD repeat-containing protein
MSTYLANVSGQTFGTQTRGFVYDELNRLTSSQVDGSANYQTSYTYDANGNITNLTRNDQSGVAMDNLTYRYATDGSGKILNNRLLHVNDDVQNSANPSDIENQGDNYAQYDPNRHNYAYDKMGNLIKDQSEEIAEITWNTAGKVTKVSRIDGSGKPDLQFDYDAKGQRIAKKVTNKNVTTGDKVVTTYYVRDPQGNVLAVYEKREDATGAGEFLLKERHLYGISRLGMVSQNVSLAQFNTSTANQTQNSTTPLLGDTHYELTNHLGNVMAVITDEVTADSTPMIANLSDYYPFGMEMGGRKFVRNGVYRYGFTGQEKMAELDDSHTTALFWEYDGRLCRRWNVDPKYSEIPSWSSYVISGDNTLINVDKQGDVWDVVADVAFVLYDIGEIAYNAVKGNDNTTSYMALTADAASIFIPCVTGSGIAVRLESKAAGLIAKSSKLLGKWEPQIQRFGKEAAAKYQAQIAKTSYELVDATKKTYKIDEYVVNGRRFDGMVDGVLVEAKHGYGNFVNKEGTGFQKWWKKGEDALIKEAKGQIEAAEGTPIKWFFSDEKVANVTKKIFEKEKINIEVVFQKLE